MSAGRYRSTETPLMSAAEIAEAATNRSAAITAADWAKRTHKSDDALHEMYDILGIGSHDLSTPSPTESEVAAQTAEAS